VLKDSISFSTSFLYLLRGLYSKKYKIDDIIRIHEEQNIIRNIDDINFNITNDMHRLNFKVISMANDIRLVLLLLMMYKIQIYLFNLIWIIILILSTLVIHILMKLCLYI
jgi:hypothetical protein